MPAGITDITEAAMGNRVLKYLLIAVFIPLFAVGCMAKLAVIDKSEATDDVLSSEYAYVLVGYSGVPSSVWLNTERSYDEAKLTELESVTFQSNIIHNVQYQMFRVIPGKYTLVDFFDSGPGKSYSMTEEAKKNNEETKGIDALLGSFTAEKGRITYIGTMHHTFSVSSQRYNFTTTNRDYEAAAFIKEHYPNINPDRVMVFVPAKRGWFIR